MFDTEPGSARVTEHQKVDGGSGAIGATDTTVFAVSRKVHAVGVQRALGGLADTAAREFGLPNQEPVDSPSYTDEAGATHGRGGRDRAGTAGSAHDQHLPRNRLPGFGASTVTVPPDVLPEDLAHHP